jgi:gas vesicle protein
LQTEKENKRRTTMKDIFTFLLGAVVGAVFALLYAPQTGEETRTKIRTTAEEDWQKLLEQSQVQLQKIQAQLDQIKTEQGQAVDPEAPEGEEAGEPA